MGQLQIEPPPERIHGDVLYAMDPDELVVIDLDQGRDRATELVVDSGSSFELFAGAIAIVSSLIGLAGYGTYVMASLATVAVGFALLAQGATIAARWQRATHIAGSERSEALGISTELFGGLAGIVLGVAAIFGVIPLTLLAVAAMVIGGALLLGGPTEPVFVGDGPRSPGRVTRDLVRSSSGVMVMAGLSSLVLGLVAVIAGGPVLTLVSVAMLVLGAALMLAGGTLVAVLARRFG
ncbi:MAG TPA: hypothetical protein VIU61_25635 [Kofleriaceae bacterium]